MDRRAAREQRFRWFLLRLAEATRCWVGPERTIYRRFDRLAHRQTGVEAVAGWGGTLFVRDQVPEQVGAVGEAEHRGAVRGPAELHVLRWTLATLLHECIHFAVPMRHLWTRAARAYATWSGMLLEEGVTETATQRLLPQLLAGMERWLPGISRRTPDRSLVYPDFVPATRELVSLVQQLPGMHGRDALLELARVHADGKLEVLAQQAMDGFGLTSQVPRPERAAVRTRLQAGLAAQFERNREWAEPRDRRFPGVLPTQDAEGRSKIMGMQAGMELRWLLHEEAERAGMRLREDWRLGLAKLELRLAERGIAFGRRRQLETRQAAQSWHGDAQRDVQTAARGSMRRQRDREAMEPARERLPSEPAPPRPMTPFATRVQRWSAANVRHRRRAAHGALGPARSERAPE